MRWRVPGEPGGDASAFDGDCDIAYGLLLAHGQWGSAGAINYQQAARDHLTAMLRQTIGPSSRLPMLGDWTDPNGSPYNQFTPRTSDFMLGHFRAFARATGNGAWNDAVTACGRIVTTLQTDHSPNTGLLPDFVQPVSAADRTPRPASPGFLEGPHDGHYFYNAGRTPWRLGTHALLSGAPSTLAQVRKISNWAKTATDGNPQRLESGYTLNGQSVNDWGFSTFFAAPLGVAAMTRPAHQGWLNALYDAVRGRSEDYYEDTVTLLCLLVMSGNFWDPTVA
jgi:endo-1,4-beta-D-glucanase Y